MKKLTWLISFLAILGCAFSLNSCGSTTTQLNNDSIHASSTKLDNDSIENYGEETKSLVFTVSTVSSTSSSLSVSVGVKLSDSAPVDMSNYYVGYFEESDKQYPAKLLYTINYSNGSSAIESAEIIKKNSNGKYDGIGNYLGADSLSTFCDISCPSGSTVDVESIKLVNVFAANVIKEDGIIVSRLPDYEHPYYVSATISTIFKKYNFNDFLEMNYVGKTNFSGYTSIKVDANSYGATVYKTLKASSYKKYQKQIEKNEYYIRTRLSFSGDSQYVFTMNDGSVITRNTISSNVELSNAENFCYFLIEDMDFSKVKNLQFYNVYVNLGIYNRAAFKEISGSSIAVSIRFNLIDLGFVDIVDSTNKIIVPKSTGLFNINVDLILSLTMIVYIAIFVIVDFSSYFYLKKKNKNDEFKVMRSGQYFRTSGISFIAIGSIILAVLTIFFRGNFLNNSIAVYNPIDVYIIIFSVLSIILIGYFIRYFYLNFKAAQEKRNNERLKLNKNVIDDGTLIMKDK